MIKIIADFISEWLQEIVILFIIISLVDLIMPKGKMKRYVDFIIGLLIIFTIINPFTRLNKITLDLDREVGNFSNMVTSDSNVKEIQDKQIKDIYITKLKQEIVKIVEDNSAYSVESININSLPDKENIFIIDGIIVMLCKSETNESSKIKVNRIQVGKGTMEVINVDNNTDGDNEELIELISEYVQIEAEKVKISINNKGDNYGGNN